MSRWPKSPFWYRDLFFGIEILHSADQHLDRLLPGINPCMLFWASTFEVKNNLDTEKEIEKSRYPKKDISIPTKRVTRSKKRRHNNWSEHEVKSLAALHGVPFPGVQVSRWKRLLSLHEPRSGKKRKKLSCAPFRGSVNLS